MKNGNKKTVLFLCTGNCARSQIAEALLKFRAGEKFDVYSAGTNPEKVDVRAIAALNQFGVEANELVSKNLTTFAGKAFDFVITLCDKANTECRNYSDTVNQLAWDIPDPKIRAGSYPFNDTLTELNNRITMFLAIEQGSTQTIKAGLVNSELSESLALDPIAFYKTLTDDIRLKTLMLTHYHGELCVCELMAALEEDSQPKVSRNLAVLKKANIITDRKYGQWVFYRINAALPLWAKTVIAQTTEHNIPMINEPLSRLAKMKNRPDKSSFCK